MVLSPRQKKNTVANSWAESHTYSHRDRKRAKSHSLTEQSAGTYYVA